MVRPGRLFRIDTLTGLQVSSEKTLAKLGVWDVSMSLDPNSQAVKDIVEAGCALVGVKPTKELVGSAQWKLFEGTGGIQDVRLAIMESSMWVQMPMDPKPELPWFNPQGWFRLPQVERELKGYRAFLEHDLETMQALGTKETRVQNWNLPPELVGASLDVLAGWRRGHYSDETARFLLGSLWAKHHSQKTSKKLGENRRSSV
jgi:hypothetical protein